MSFIDLMSKDAWTDADITRRTEAMIHSQISEQEELILNRKVTGQALGQYTLSLEEQAQLIKYVQVTTAAKTAGESARADLVQLNKIFEVEPSWQRLQRSVVEPVLDELGAVINQEEIDADLLERSTAQAIVSLADATTLEWIGLRNPPIPEVVTTPLEAPLA